MVDEDERITIEEIAETLGIWHRRPVKHDEVFTGRCAKVFDSSLLSDQSVKPEGFVDTPSMAVT